MSCGRAWSSRACGEPRKGEFGHGEGVVSEHRKWVWSRITWMGVVSDHMDGCGQGSHGWVWSGITWRGVVKDHMEWVWSGNHMDGCGQWRGCGQWGGRGQRSTGTAVPEDVSFCRGPVPTGSGHPDLDKGVGEILRDGNVDPALAGQVQGGGRVGILPVEHLWEEGMLRSRSLWFPWIAPRRSPAPRAVPCTPSLPTHPPRPPQGPT